MLRIKFYSLQVVIIVLFDLLFVGLFDEMVLASPVTWFLILVNFLFFIISGYFAKLGIFFLFLQKLSLILYVTNGLVETSGMLKLTAWLGFFCLYAYYFLLESNEAYLNPNYSEHDLSLKSYQLSGVTNSGDIFNFVVTNISENGFYGVTENNKLSIGKVFDGVIDLVGQKYTLKGRVVKTKNSGFGVKVVINKNWDKLYTKAKRLKTMDCI